VKPGSCSDNSYQWESRQCHVALIVQRGLFIAFYFMYLVLNFVFFRFFFNCFLILLLVLLLGKVLIFYVVFFFLLKIFYVVGGGKREL
jgi:hypothetical protein